MANIVVLVKQVPDSGLERSLSADDNTVDRAGGNLVISELDENAIEAALAIKEAQGGEVTVLTVGPEQATETIRKALSMGPDGAVHVQDEAIHGSDAVQTSLVIAEAVKTLSYDLVIAGAESTDGQVGALPALLAERLGVPQVTGARALELADGTVKIERQTDDGYQVVQAATPAIVSVWDTINEPRYPSFKGIMQAKKKPVKTLSLADLGVSADQVGLGSAHTEVVEFAPRPPRGEGVKVTDEGDGGTQLVEFLAGQKIV